RAGGDRGHARRGGSDNGGSGAVVSGTRRTTPHAELGVDDLVRARPHPASHGAVDLGIPWSRDRRRGARLQSPGRLASRCARSTIPDGVDTHGRRLEGKSMSYDIDALREREFPWAARGDAIYLNNAA